MARLSLGVLGLWLLLRAEVLAQDWELVSSQVPWQGRDSAGSVVYQDQLWLFGGWYDSEQPALRDVWRSGNGRCWTQVTSAAPWDQADFPMTTVFRDSIWLMGGWHNGRLPDAGPTNAVWRSVDGAMWETAPAPAWSARFAAGVAEFQGQLWILGGIDNYHHGNEDSLMNDVWRSADGESWERVAEHAPWPARGFLQAAVFKDRLWVMGGGTYLPTYVGYNDVWSSADGIVWREETPSAEWDPRIWHASAVYRDQLWVLGGWSDEPATNYGDAWRSSDGRSWTRFASEVMWSERHAASAYVLDDKLWVAAGFSDELHQEVWSLELPSPETPDELQKTGGP